MESAIAAPSPPVAASGDPVPPDDLDRTSAIFFSSQTRSLMSCRDDVVVPVFCESTVPEWTDPDCVAP
eukprot:CAMPEP_0183307936 /NCGR_PEP_ID=MMETSP0160_2-20130417/19647_1 /TAXON_ID=2839 ORGANISM="Odontella Sinensis, Strain Grunow 1884" /NCGR_SAMPLE_ID=MMETSP0160_2 /ASSEMBLY_ACC=CAM_ASM_000250 /LENGTH=67 /DNA_ID=CAMNT_0025471659 /DNA_START=470 /DNA_END=670 /DNA_ORIENTATION=-